MCLLVVVVFVCVYIYIYIYIIYIHTCIRGTLRERPCRAASVRESPRFARMQRRALSRRAVSQHPLTSSHATSRIAGIKWNGGEQRSELQKMEQARVDSTVTQWHELRKQRPCVCAPHTSVPCQ